MMSSETHLDVVHAASKSEHITTSDPRRLASYIQNHLIPYSGHIMDHPTAIVIIILVLFTLTLYFLGKPPAQPLPPLSAISIHDPQDRSFAKTNFPTMRYYDISATE